MLSKKFTFSIITLFIFSIGFAAHGGDELRSSAYSGPLVTADEFYAYFKVKTPQVIELEYIKKAAEKMVIHVWLFGGTAATYAHYLKWDIQRKKGDSRFQGERFDYDFTNIYRSNQDLDIVIDGNEEQAIELERLLSEKYEHLRGDKSAWEVRLLKDNRGEKVALLNNPDFSDQHTDSNSTGLIEITNSGGPVVRDLRDWNSDAPFFLRDVLEGKLHFYFSDKHHTTRFFLQGRNPPIIAAIRYLTKAVQFELSCREDDLRKIQTIIDAFDIDAARHSPYISHWIEKNAKKLIQNAVNIEYAWNLIEGLGLRSKLIHIKNDVDTKESLAWWLSKEPLRSFEVGKGIGKTAAEIFKERGVPELIVSHEANNFSAYESITSAHTGDANVLASRSGSVGEEASFGSGLYTRIGQTGARGTGITVRFRVDPKAKEGVDFTTHNVEDGYLLFKNKNAIHVIPESLNLSLVDFFETIFNGGLKQSDKALYIKLKRRLSNSSLSTSADDIEKIKSIIITETKKSEPRLSLIKEWFSFALSVRNIEFTKDLIWNLDARSPGSGYRLWAETAKNLGVWTKNSSPMIKWSLEKYGHSVFITNYNNFFRDPTYKDEDNLLDLSLRKADDATRYNICAGYVKRVFSQNLGPIRTPYLEKWLESRIDIITSQTKLDDAQKKELIEILYLLGRGKRTSQYHENSQHLWDDRIDLVEKVSRFVVNAKEIPEDILEVYTQLILPRIDFFSKEGVELVLSKKSEKLNKIFLEKVAFQNGYVALKLWERFDPEIYQRSINVGFIHAGSEIKNHPQYMEFLFERLLQADAKISDEVADVIVQGLSGDSHWLDAPHFVRLLMAHKRNKDVLRVLTSHPAWLKHPDLYRDFFKNLNVKDLFNNDDQRSSSSQQHLNPRGLMRLILKAAGTNNEVMNIFMRNNDNFLKDLIETTLTDPFQNSYTDHSYYANENHEDAQALMFRYLLHYRPYKPEILVKLKNYKKDFPHLKDISLAKYPFLLEEAVNVYIDLTKEKSPWAKSHFLILEALFKTKASDIPELIHMCGGPATIESMIVAMSEGKTLYKYQSFKKFGPSVLPFSCKEAMRDFYE